MFSLRALVWSLLQAVLVATLDVAEQRVLTLQDPGLVLRRFIAGPSDGTWNVHAIHAAAQASGLDIWQVGPSYLDVRLPAANESLNALTQFAGLQYSDSIIPSSLVRPQTLSGAQANWNLSSLSNTTFHSTYHSIEDIGVFVKELLDLYPDNVELARIGHSSENREMFVLEISKDKGLRGRPLSMKKKTGFVISGAQHAREPTLSLRPRLNPIPWLRF
ncbi:hypothetical protein PHLCEN_2v11352 [Hermanssonia centrifuga]|uniref:Peptidase M14 domain-containing protein n=1 Tax=Hermanssonia centrifuga TaxID=98765 RepID=A0A2R6NK86_9APHY|nr:hypothetical protein PHLCEN_2v11352 [Hermanssonia centrifuga]